MKYYDKNTLIYLDGAFVKASEAALDPFAQSLHYGYAVFDGLRAYNTHNGPVYLKLTCISIA
ncbi:hypothetical protein [Sphingobacterium sp. UGAL515B_05]|uniref:hypothetical protein n=1 Tax=Sphingobacterium sp. UGAL515B_05 TaxID=2986767 RepID=UPI0029551960|nr:hypothetical protein [Sphingobacterium sp. UGAL515B_05]WON96756.1 hypothetical protein OK025_10170 [Sphingobacterium sp. UGAL515B_05]